MNTAGEIVFHYRATFHQRDSENTGRKHQAMITASIWQYTSIQCIAKSVLRAPAFLEGSHGRIIRCVVFPAVLFSTKSYLVAQFFADGGVLFLWLMHVVRKTYPRSWIISSCLLLLAMPHFTLAETTVSSSLLLSFF